MKEKLLDLIGKILIIYYILSFIFNMSILSKYYNPTIMNIYMIINLTINIILMIIIEKEYRTNYTKVEKFDYYRNLEIKEIKPIEAGTLIKKNKLGFNTILIILFDLIDENIIKVKHHNNKTYIQLQDKINKDFVDKLPIEKADIIKLIFSGTDDKNEYEIGQIIKILKNDIGKRMIIDINLQEINSKIRRKYYIGYADVLAEKINNGLLNFAIILGLILPIVTLFPFIGIVLTMTDITFKIYTTILLYIIDAIIIFIILSKYYIKNCYLEDVNKLNGLYNFLDDFSNIKSSEIKYIEIYDKYYLYALSFGLTDKIEKDYKIKSLCDKTSLNLKYLFYNIEKIDDNLEGEKND